MFTSRITIAFTYDTIFSFSFQTCAKSSRCRLTLSPWSWEARSSSGATRRRASQSQGWAILKLVSPFSFGSPCSSILLWFILSLCNTDGTQPPADWMLSVICNLSALLWQICSFIFCPDRQSSHKKEAFRWWVYHNNEHHLFRSTGCETAWRCSRRGTQTFCRPRTVTS